MGRAVCVVKQLYAVWRMGPPHSATWSILTLPTETATPAGLQSMLQSGRCIGTILQPGLLATMALIPTWDVDWVPIFEALSADLSAAKVPILGPKCRQSAEIPTKRRSIQIHSKRV
eukprot:COSAG02_NODE_934_length_15809_cov_59.853787_4_plen_116_part_00